ncbi:MAG TPA: phosphatidate cytidylyltransferase [Burkholderiales bacterium]|nr:phosphatidate cytidylyltransferase [Burkholderiales bacterium]
MFTARLATAIALLVICISALLLLPNPWWTALLLPALLAASWEWGGLMGLSHAARSLFVGFMVASLIMVWLLAAHFEPVAGRLTVPEVLIYGASCLFWCFIALVWLRRRWPLHSMLVLGAVGWIVLIPSWLVLARFQDSPGRLLAVLTIIWLADTAAYLSGKAWGKHKMAPAVSPGKTWEGAAGAAAAVAVYYLILSRVVPEWGWWNGFGGAALFAGVAVMSVVGDLFESAIKRQAGVKDSGTLLPGHGGVLDRMDSMTAALPVAALLLPYTG